MLEGLEKITKKDSENQSSYRESYLGIHRKEAGIIMYIQ
jgi:uncharacterized protein YnzC (UPF0291/DUF896 family)